eukprot:3545086-Pyramimonas_sp.AAC.1
MDAVVLAAVVVGLGRVVRAVALVEVKQRPQAPTRLCVSLRAGERYAREPEASWARPSRAQP